MADNNEICKNIILAITLIISSCLVTRFINEKYVKPQESNKLILEMREQLSNLQSTLFSLDEMRLEHAEKMDRIRRAEDELKRIDLWKKMIDIIHNHHPHPTPSRKTETKPPARTTTPIPIKNKLYHSANSPASLLVRALTK